GGLMCFLIRWMNCFGELLGNCVGCGEVGKMVGFGGRGIGRGCGRELIELGVKIREEDADVGEAKWCNWFNWC
ncbi:hypothetical protein, partial [Bacillus altitudinis]|uniref:hypothetical protein n=1 Tax=Bacillus altitudinis TaxID=293387 RepID=UPI001C92ED8E